VKIGIIGAENSHTGAIANVLNVQKLVKGFTIDYVWGETPAFAKAAAAKGQIPNIVSRPSDMLGKIDAVIVDHRHGKYHLRAVTPFIKAGVPTFVDKPFCYRAKEGRTFLALAKKCGTPVTSFGVFPLQKSFLNIKKKVSQLGNILSAETYYTSDIKSPWGGVFFYGIHQMEPILEAFGYDVKWVQATKNGHNANAQLLYPSGLIVTMHMIKQGCKVFHFAVLGENGFLQEDLLPDKNIYLTGIKCFTKMFKTGIRPFTDKKILQPVRVLEAVEKSLKSGKKEKVI